MGRKVSKDIEYLAINLYLKGVEVKSIAKKLDICRNTVTAIRKRNNTPTRSYNKYTINKNFMYKNTHKKFWFIGLMSADGNIKNDRTFSITQSGENGKKILKYLISELNYTGILTKFRNAYTLTVTDKTFVNIFKKYGVVKNKTLTLEPINIPNKYFKSFLRGYFEGDGSVGIYFNASKTEYLCSSFVGTFEAITYFVKNIPKGYRLRKIVRCKNLIEIRYNGSNSYIFLKWLFENKKLYRSYKYDIFKKYISKLPDVVRYVDLKIEAKKLYKSEISCMEISNKIKIPFQTVYKWRSKGFFY